MQRVVVPTSELLDLLLSEEAIEKARECYIESQSPPLVASDGIDQDEPCETASSFDAAFKKAAMQSWKLPSAVVSDAAVGCLETADKEKDITATNKAENDATTMPSTSEAPPTIIRNKQEEARATIAHCIEKAMRKVEEKRCGPGPGLADSVRQLFHGPLSSMAREAQSLSQAIFDQAMNQLKEMFQPQNPLAFIASVSRRLIAENWDMKEPLRLLAKSYAESSIGPNYQHEMKND